jgi:hypothetical protein
MEFMTIIYFIIVINSDYVKEEKRKNPSSCGGVFASAGLPLSGTG